MKIGLTPNELAVELQRQKDNKKDFLLDTRAMAFTGLNNLTLDSRLTNNSLKTHDLLEGELISGDSFPVQHRTHRQIGTHLSIPAKYYDRLMSPLHEELFTTTLNYWLHNEPSVRMLRVLDNKARAFLGERYKRIDNYDVMEIALQEFLKRDDLSIDSCNVTEENLYIKATFGETRVAIAPGDEIQFGTIITNSEVGSGALQVKPFIKRLVCSNGLIVDQFSSRRIHVGEKIYSEDSINVVMQTDTRVAIDRALLLKFRDSINTMFLPQTQEIIRNSISQAQSRTFNSNIPEIVELTAETFGLSQTESSSIMSHLINDGGDASAWGLVNAVTRTAEDATNYDRATTLEAIGGTLLGWKPNNWNSLLAKVSKN